jgi:hypothetical protein
MAGVPKAEALEIIDLRVRELQAGVTSLRSELPLLVGNHDTARALAEASLRSIEHVLGLYEYRRSSVSRQPRECVRLRARCTVQPSLWHLEFDDLS